MKEPNRVYIASKVNAMESTHRILMQELENRGYCNVYDWTQTPVQKPFEAHQEETSHAARAMAMAVMNCDFLIVLCAPNGIGYHIETGGALVASIILDFIQGSGRKKIYIVGEGNNRSVFYFDKSVTRVDTVKELLEYFPALTA